MTGGSRASLPPGRTVRVIGPGRAGRSMAAALAGVGWEVAGILGRGDDVAASGDGVDLVVIATPDAQVRHVASAIDPRPHTVVAHLSGSLGLAATDPARHPRVGVLHPLVAMPDPELGALRLVGAWYAVAGDPLVTRVVEDLGGRWFTVADDAWAAYHAAAVIASNHVVALLGQAERVAATAGVDFEVYLDLVRATLDNVEALGPAGALTGPAARGDLATIAGHLAALDPRERPGYQAGVDLARRLAEATWPADADSGPSDPSAADADMDP